MKNIVEQIEEIIVLFNEIKQSYIITINDLNHIIVEPRKDDNGNIIQWGTI